jgi:TonB family protein
MPLPLLALLSVAGSSAGAHVAQSDSFCVWQTGSPCVPGKAPAKPVKLNSDEFEAAKAALETTDAPATRVRSASTLVAFDIDAAGELTNCRIVESSGTPQLDASVCPNVLKNGRVGGTPGPDGKFIPTTRQLRISWRTEG